MYLKNLIAEPLLAKLMQTRFAKPSKNVSVWRYYNATKEYYELLRAESSRSGTTQEYLQELLDTTEIKTEVPGLGIDADDFGDENCSFSEDKRYWLNANEIASIVRYCKKWK